MLKKAGAIGLATLPNPRPPAGTTQDAPTPSTGAEPGGGRAQAPQPTIVLADRELHEQAGQSVSITIARGGVEKFLAGSGHTLDELQQLIADK